MADDHVVHGIGWRHSYVIGDCVADLWCAASAPTELVPELPDGRLGYLGESFGGGLGALALPWDERFAAAQLRVPTFGNHPLCLTLPCVGSGEAVRRHYRSHPGIADVLAYYDAATAATRMTVPVLGAPSSSIPRCHRRDSSRCPTRSQAHASCTFCRPATSPTPGRSSRLSRCGRPRRSSSPSI